MNWNSVGAKRVENNQIISAGFGRVQRNTAVAQHHVHLAASVSQVPEIRGVCGDLLDQRIDLVERPPLTLLGITGQAASAKTNDCHTTKATANSREQLSDGS